MHEELPTLLNKLYSSSSLNLYDYSPNNFNSNNAFVGNFLLNQNQQKEKEKPMAEKKLSLRLTKIFIIDSDINLPFEKRLLFQDEKLTDLTDQELFFDYPIKDMLNKHNEYRSTLLDKEQTKVQGKDIKLEPIRIKDLKMITVDIFSV